jgi:peptidoglycan-N-acetylglucosamine deacetylase
VLGLQTLGTMIALIGRASRHLVFYCHPSEFIHAKDQSFPKSMSKWNTRGMGPKNLSLLETLLDFLSDRHFVATPMMGSAVAHLDVRRPVVIRARAFS